MTHTGDPDIEQLLDDARARPCSPVPRKELVAELILGALLLAAVTALALAVPSDRTLSAAGAAGFVLLYAISQRVRFEVGAGHTAPGELVLVPMLLLVPPAATPILVALGCLVARLPAYVRGRQHPTRIAFVLPDAWHAVGPAAVIALLAPGAPSLHNWPVYVLALVAAVAFDVGSSTLREWCAAGVPPSLQLRLLGWVVGVDLLLAPAGLLAALAGHQNPLAVALVLPTMGLLAVFARERRSRIDHALALSHAYRGTAMLMSDVLTASDDYTGGEHSHGVVALSLAVGDQLGIDGRDRRNLEFAALLHDVGKINVPDAILNKPGRLTDEEFEIIKRHPADGQQMLERIGGVLADVGVIVRHHHERWDGRGYPDRIAGDTIPLPARIVCACDAFSAMTTDRSYRRAMPEPTALAELRDCAGSQFDPAVVDAILAVCERAGATPAAATLVSVA
jgi:HD-GYP domain-containing protein (c-di-GMP phosphodiesterase class II)